MRHRIFLARPRQPGPTTPVLYMLDGNGAFDFLTPTLLAEVPQLAVVGIGYDTDEQFARAERVYDYTAPLSPMGAPYPDPQHPERLAGGVEAFTKRLLGPLRDAAEAELNLTPAGRSLWGHSFGALCALHVAAHRPDAFHRYALISPSIWWNEHLAKAQSARVAFGQPTAVMVGLGGREQRTGSAAPAPTGPSPLSLDFARGLGTRPGVDLRLEIYPDATHIATLPASLPATLRLAAQT